MLPDPIQLISKLEQCHALQDELFSAPLFGFDSESKPTFRKGEVTWGLMSFNWPTADQAYVFQISPAIFGLFNSIFENPKQTKVGWLKMMPICFVKRHSSNQVLDLAKAFTAFGIHDSHGVKNAMALLFQVNFPKSKSVNCKLE